MNTLILIPTDMERRQLAEFLRSAVTADDRLELCGFGPIAAAARTASLLAAERPRRVVLLGIAGGLHPDLSTGMAAVFSSVACYGVGAGTGAAFQPASEMGWPQWPGDPADEAAVIGDCLTLCGGDEHDGFSTQDAWAGQLLTACAASACAADGAERRRLFPQAVAEDMEGFGVAAACRMANVPLSIVRGISNRAGNRDLATWQISEALAAAGRLACQLLAPSGSAAPHPHD